MGVLVVTGGSRGIGAEICRLGAQRDWAVCVNYASSADEANGVVAEIEASGGRAIAAQADVSAPEAAERMFDCAFRGMAATDSDLTRPPIPIDRGHRFRAIAASLLRR